MGQTDATAQRNRKTSLVMDALVQEKRECYRESRLGGRRQLRTRRHAGFSAPSPQGMKQGPAACRGYPWGQKPRFPGCLQTPPGPRRSQEGPREVSGLAETSKRWRPTTTPRAGRKPWPAHAPRQPRGADESPDLQTLSRGPAGESFGKGARRGCGLLAPQRGHEHAALGSGTVPAHGLHRLTASDAPAGLGSGFLQP